MCSLLLAITLFVKTSLIFHHFPSTYYVAYNILMVWYYVLVSPARQYLQNIVNPFKSRRNEFIFLMQFLSMPPFGQTVGDFWRSTFQEFMQQVLRFWL